MCLIMCQDNASINHLFYQHLSYSEQHTTFISRVCGHFGKLKIANVILYLHFACHFTFSFVVVRQELICNNLKAVFILKYTILTKLVL